MIHVASDNTGGYFDNQLFFHRAVLSRWFMSWPIWGGLLGKQRVFLIKLTQITKLSGS